jgi:hypothetical protein
MTVCASCNGVIWTNVKRVEFEELKFNDGKRDHTIPKMVKHYHEDCWDAIQTLYQMEQMRDLVDGGTRPRDWWV